MTVENFPTSSDLRSLTMSEQSVLELLTRAWSEFLGLPRIHPDDQSEFRFAIHAAQNIILSRPALRQLNYEIDRGKDDGE